MATVPAARADAIRALKRFSQHAQVGPATPPPRPSLEALTVCVRFPHTDAHHAHPHTVIPVIPAGFPAQQVAGLLLPGIDVLWFYEKQDALLVCEIRKADDETVYEFEIADSQGPKTQRFASPKELIAAYLNEESRLRAAGWRPRAGNIEALE